MEKKEKTKHKMKLPWWLWAIIGLVVVYLINGIVFACIIYKSYPNNLASGKKYPDQQKVTVFMTKIYPYPAAWVNWRPIWVKDYYKQLGFVRHFSEKTQQQMPENSTLEKQVIDQMVDTELLRQQAKKYKITVSTKDIDDTYNQLVEENNGEEQVSQILEELYGMSVKDFKGLIKDQLLSQKVQDELFTTVTAKHILIKDETKAKEVLEMVKKGEKSFEDLAKEYSEDTGSRDNGGDLGSFGRGMMVKEFEDAVFAMQPNTVSDNLVKTEYGYHIIKLESKTGQVDMSYLDWYNQVKSQAKIKIWINTTAKDSGNTNVISPSVSASSSAETATPTVSASASN